MQRQYVTSIAEASKLDDPLIYCHFGFAKGNNKMARNIITFVLNIMSKKQAFSDYVSLLLCVFWSTLKPIVFVWNIVRTFRYNLDISEMTPKYTMTTSMSIQDITMQMETKKTAILCFQLRIIKMLPQKRIILNMYAIACITSSFFDKLVIKNLHCYHHFYYYVDKQHAQD